MRLARRTAVALRDASVSAVRLRYDATLFGAPPRRLSGSPTSWPVGVVAPITALSADGGRLNPPASPRSPNPPLTAAQSFARLLQQRDIQVLGEAHRHLPPVTDGGGRIRPLADLVEHLLLTSDNTEADILAHQVGLEVLDDRPSPVVPRHPAGTGGARHRHQRHRAQRRQRAVAWQPDQPRAPDRCPARRRRDRPEQLWPVCTGLPVARFDGSPGLTVPALPVRVRPEAVTSKTGTLTGTSTWPASSATATGNCSCMQS